MFHIPILMWVTFVDNKKGWSIVILKLYIVTICRQAKTWTSICRDTNGIWREVFLSRERGKWWAVCSGIDWERRSSRAIVIGSDVHRERHSSGATFIGRDVHRERRPSGEMVIGSDVQRERRSSGGTFIERVEQHYNCKEIRIEKDAIVM